MVLPLVGYALLALAALAALLWGVGTFNDLVRTRARVRQEFANVEVALGQRHDEIPGLVEVCRAYAKHEAEVLERVTELRQSYQRARGINEKVLVENQMILALAGLPAIVEAYPDLKANEQFSRLQARLSEIETMIADRRALYNQATTYYNSEIEQFPQLLFARLFRFQPGELFELDEPDEAAAPEIELAVGAK